MTTRTFLLGATAALALAGTAGAGASGWYAGLEGGANWIDDNQYDWGSGFPGPVTDFNNAASYDTGWTVLATVGYGSPSNWRVEAELGYRRNNIDQFFSATGTSVYASGDLGQASLMANVYYDLKVGSKLTLSLGAGAGADYAMLDDGNPGGIDDGDLAFAYQGIAGVSYDITDRLALTANYRYFRAQEPEFRDNGLIEEFEDVAQHTATVGLRFALAGAAAPVETPPAPPVTPPEMPREFIVFFGHNQSNLTPEAIDVVKQAAATAKEVGAASISLVGHADRSGSTAYNEALSLKRATEVKKALATEGVPETAITVSGKGEGEPLVPTADGVREPQNRRVHISL